jgi:predicted  nucleic acid-binding Zn-ribbon protein
MYLGQHTFDLDSQLKDKSVRVDALKVQLSDERKSHEELETKFRAAQQNINSLVQHNSE